MRVKDLFLHLKSLCATGNTEQQSHLFFILQSLYFVVYLKVAINGNDLGTLNWPKIFPAYPVQLVCFSRKQDLASPDLSGRFPGSRRLLKVFQPQNLASDIQSGRVKYLITWYCPEFPSQLMDIIVFFWEQIRFIDWWKLLDPGHVFQGAKRGIAKKTGVVIQNCALSLALSQKFWTSC